MSGWWKGGNKLMTSIRLKLYLASRRVWSKIYPRIKQKLKPVDFRVVKTMVEPSERIVEYPFIFRNIVGLKGAKILDVGCSGSYLLTELAALGHEVYGIDIRWYPVQYPNVRFVQGNICKTLFPNDFFDVIIAVSTIEHIGIEEPRAHRAHNLNIRIGTR